MPTINLEALADRARNLGSLNGIQRALVTLTPPAAPAQALLEVHFFNANHVAEILADYTAVPALAKSLFPIGGGHRLPAGPATGQIQTVSIAAGPAASSLVLTVAPIGDYSTYTLGVSHSGIDPVFSEIGFKFRPGCFSTDCAPDWTPGVPAAAEPPIDYLAKDYDSFKHTMIAAMMTRVPNWTPTSEADLDQTLLELFSAAADELSDYQDRVMNEAYLGTARKRVSLARHARLMDYHIHQGNQAGTWLALSLAAAKSGDLPAGLTAWTGLDANYPAAVVFTTKTARHLDSLLNALGLYTWSGAIPTLLAGDSGADLKVPGGAKVTADTIRDLFRSGQAPEILIQEWRNPATGGEAGRDPRKRQLLRLLTGAAAADSVQDPLTGEWMVRVRWSELDALLHNYCFEVSCQTSVVADVSLFHGNLVQAYHGAPAASVFQEPGSVLATDSARYFERPDRWGVLCRLPGAPLAYANTPPGGEDPPQSTLQVEVDLPDGSTRIWTETISLIHSDDSETDGSRFMVETDELGQSVIRFGNGVNGMELPENAAVRCAYQVGAGLDGNIGADSLRGLNQAFDPLMSGASVWNPFDVTDGRAPEPAAEILRRVPEAYRGRHLRAVTLCDYEARARELTQVSRASASYAWTGSWRTVRIAIDPAGAVTLDDALRVQIANYLEPVRLIGEDLEIRPPLFVPLQIEVSLCVGADYWREDVRYLLEQEFSAGVTPDGRLGFFHPDLWTFGQELHASQIVGRIQRVEGIAHVISVSMKRWDAPDADSDAIVALRPNEIILVENDPDHMELGMIDFQLSGGRG